MSFVDMVRMSLFLQPSRIAYRSSCGGHKARLWGLGSRRAGASSRDIRCFGRAFNMSLPADAKEQTGNEHYRDNNAEANTDANADFGP